MPKRETTPDLPAEMTVIEISEPGGPEVLKRATRPVPVPKAGEILIRVRAAGVNRPDIQQRAGAYPPPPGASDLLGLEAAGEVAAIGPGGSIWRVGDHVTRTAPGRWLRRIRRDPRGAGAAGAGGARLDQGGGAARDLLHRLGERLRSRAPRRRARPSSCTAGPPASGRRRSSSPPPVAPASSPPRLRRKVRNLPRARRRARDRLPDGGLRRRGARRDQRTRRRRHPRHGRAATTWRATSGAGAGRPPGDDRAF